MLEIKNASLSLGGRQLFAGLSLTLDKGEMACVSGVSGAGKTSLLRAILGFLPLNEGDIFINGKRMTATSAEMVRRQMAYVPQEVMLPHDTVEEMVQVPFSLKANTRKVFRKAELMKEWEILGLEEALYHQKVSEVSGGQRQRIMLSIAGLLRKPILVVDEPTSALDSTSSAQVANYLRTLANEGTIVIMVSHDEQLAAACDYQVRIEVEG